MRKALTQHRHRHIYKYTHKFITLDNNNNSFICAGIKHPHI